MRVEGNRATRRGEGVLEKEDVLSVGGNQHVPPLTLG